VREAAVVAREHRGEPRLVAYVVEREPSGSSSDLRAHLRAVLPEPMVPSAFVRLSALPVTPNGKVDRAALPPPPLDGPGGEPAGPGPRTDLERAISRVWREVLQLERVGVRESFFDLGGHSLLLVPLQAGLEEVAGRPVPMVELFRHPTVESQAGWIAEAALGPTQRARARERAGARRAALLDGRAAALRRRRGLPRGVQRG
jgi:hypothetical protein